MVSSTITLQRSSSIFSNEISLLLTPKPREKETENASPKPKGTEKEAENACKHEAKCELVDYHSLPNFLKHNEFVLSYYRSEWPLKQTLLSLFAVHNETLNVWTHLVGFFIFLSLTACTAMMLPMDGVASAVPDALLSSNMTHSHGLQHELVLLAASSLTANQTTGGATARWPFYAYLGGAMFCLLMSSACHLLSCHSEHTCYVMLRLDYAGITALIVTSFYPLVYYSFMCHPFFLNLYITFITIFGVATVIVSLVPVFETPQFRAVRAGLFVCMAVSGLVPIVHKAAVFGDRPEALLTTGYEIAMLALYGLGVVVYVARVPERWLPGRFDLVGHSHQLFHVLVIAGAYTHYMAGLVYLSWRDLEGGC